MFGQAAITIGSGGKAARAKLHGFDRDEWIGGRRGNHGDGRHERQRAIRGDEHLVGAHRHDDCALDAWRPRRRVGQPRAESFTGFRQLAAHIGGQRSSAGLDPVPLALVVECPLLIQQPPAGPAQGHGDHEGGQRERRKERVRGAEHSLGMVTLTPPVEVITVSGLCQRVMTSEVMVRPPQA